MRKKTESMKADIRGLPAYQREIAFFKAARVARVTARLKAPIDDPMWTGTVRLVAGADARVIGTGNGDDRKLETAAGGKASKDIYVVGMQPEDALAWEDVGNEARTLFGHKVGGLLTQTVVDRMLQTDCGADFDRLRADIDRKLLDPAYHASAEAALTARIRREREKARERRMKRFLETILPTAVADGMDEHRLVDAFRLGVAALVTES